MQLKFNLQELRKASAKLKELRTLPKKFKDLNKRTKVIIGILGLVLVLGGVYGIASLGNEPAAAQVITGAVKKGEVKKVITASGTASLSQVIPLSFGVGGTIQEIYAGAGDRVAEGQPLVQLDTESLEQALKEARENLDSAQAGFQQSIGDLGRKVKTNLVQAEKSLLTAQQNADSYYLEHMYYLAELNFQTAGNKLANAQGSGEADTYQLQVALSQAQISLLNARNNRDGGAGKELEVAQDSYNAALKAARDFEKGVSNEYLSAKANLTQSETKLLTAQENLDKATLKAPMAGTIISSEVKLYQNVGTTSVMSFVADSQDFTVSASVDQADITEIEVGQTVELTLDTAPAEIIAGTVSGVSLKGTNTQNVITYGITIDVDNPSSILRDQMNVNVSIITKEAKEVLTIPSQAVVMRGKITGVLLPQGTSQGERPSQAPRTAGSSAALQTDSQYRFVPIEIGLNDGTNAEVISGLSEGQVVIVQIIQPAAAGTTSTQNTQSPGSFGNMSPPTGGAGRLR